VSERVSERVRERGEREGERERECVSFIFRAKFLCLTKTNFVVIPTSLMVLKAKRDSEKTNGGWDSNMSG